MAEETARRHVAGALPVAELAMCQRVTCEKCGKPSWVGCGQHVEQVLGDVPPDQRCQCERPKSLLSRLFGR